MILKLLLISSLSFLFLSNEVFSQKFDAEIIKYSTLCEVGSGKMTETDSVTIQINNRAGDKYTEIELPYSKTNRISDVDAWIENMNGTRVRELKKSDIVDKSAISDISLYEDDFIKCFELKHNVYPYKVTYTYKTTSKSFMLLASWSPTLYNAIPTKSAKLKIILPKHLQYNKFENNLPEPCRIDSSGKDLVLQWHAVYDKPIFTELYSQPVNSVSYVKVAPLFFEYGVEGSTKDWKSYGNWAYKLNKDLDILPDEEKNTIATLINGITDKREIVKTLYHYMQDHTRYINVSIGIGGLKPYPAAYVATNKYGDCKALTNYMKAILSFAGIESFYTEVYAGDQPRTINKNFVAHQFNHVVLAVPMVNDTIWLENTSNTNPFGFMGTFTQNRDALLICKDQSRFVHIPALKKEDVQVSNKLTFDLNLEGKTKVTVHNSFRGRDFESFDQLQASFNPNEKDQIIKDYMPFDNYEVLNWNIKKLNRDTTHIDLIATLNLNKFLKPLGDEYYFSLYPCRIPGFSLPGNRMLPVELPYPICNSDSLIYILPSGYEMKTRLDTVSIKSKYGNYMMTTKVIEGKIFVTKKFELFSGLYPLDKYTDFYAFIQSVKEIDRKKIIIKPSNKS